MKGTKISLKTQYLSLYDFWVNNPWSEKEFCKTDKPSDDCTLASCLHFAYNPVRPPFVLESLLAVLLFASAKELLNKLTMSIERPIYRTNVFSTTKLILSIVASIQSAALRIYMTKNF